MAVYDLGIGTIERGNNTKDCYEVPAQQWADLSDKDGGFGVAILNDTGMPSERVLSPVSGDWAK